MKTILFILTLISYRWYLNGQTPDLTEELAEHLSDEIQESLTEGDVFDQFLIENFRIINANSASKNDLKKIPWLTNVQIQNFIDYINLNGPLVSIYELQAIPAWDLATIRMTAPLIRVTETGSTFDPRSLRDQLKQDGGLELLVRAKKRIQLSRGYHQPGNSGYQGSPIYWLYKFRYRKKGAIDIGINLEKDPGEKFTWAPDKGLYGADHTSFYIKLENLGPIKKLMLGDYRAQWDQGLVLGGGLSFKKQVITGPRKVHSGLAGHTGTREFGYYRGIGIELQAGHIAVSTMLSSRKLDAQLNFPDTIAALPLRVPSIIETGLHRTGTELERRGSLPETIAALHLRTSFSENLATSVSGVYRVLKIPLVPAVALHNKYNFSGRENFNLSASLEYQHKNLSIYSQFAVSKSQGWAALAGLTASLSHNVSMTIHLRNYGKEYHGISSGATGIANANQNEQGIYWGIQVAPSHEWIFGFYTNIFRFPKPTFTSDAFSHGIEQLLRAQFKPSRSTYIDFYWRSRKKLVNSEVMANKLTHNLTEETKHQAVLRAQWQNEHNVTLQTRIQYSSYNKSDLSTSGMIVSTQISYNLKIMRLTISMAHFNTDNFQNRQYIYEKDLPYSLSIPFFDGIGVRWFCMIQLNLMPKLDFWLKVAQSNYKDRDQLGSGLDTVNGPKRTDLSLQIRYKL